MGHVLGFVHDEQLEFANVLPERFDALAAQPGLHRTVFPGNEKERGRFFCKNIPQQGSFTYLPGTQQYHDFSGNQSVFNLRLNNSMNFYILIHKIWRKIMYYVRFRIISASGTNRLPKKN